MTRRSPEEAKAAFPIVRFFEASHLPEPQRLIASQLADMAWCMAETLPMCPETTAGLRKLLEAKDCFVRASLPPEPV